MLHSKLDPDSGKLGQPVPARHHSLQMARTDSIVEVFNEGTDNAKVGQKRTRQDFEDGNEGVGLVKDSWVSSKRAKLAEDEGETGVVPSTDKP